MEQMIQRQSEIRCQEIPSTEPKRQYYFIEQVKKLIAQQQQVLQRPLTATVQTFGCQMNARDSEKICGILREVGYRLVSEEEADFVLYNTCTVRENANTRVYGRLGKLKHLKKSRPHMLIGLCGCMMQEAKVVETIQEKYPFVNLIFGTHNLYQFAELLEQALLQSQMVVKLQEKGTQIVEELPVQRKYPFKSGVNIMFGCDNFCSYCIVPYVRGRERSRKPEDIVSEIQTLVADGVVEIMLLGQNVNSYGKNLETPVSFAELLRRISQIKGLKRIRFMTSHPKDLSGELITVMKEANNVSAHLHLPVQSGSNRILQEMNRRYTKEHYIALVQKLRSVIPDISLTTDIIVGFPGETEEDFLETIDLVRQVKYDSVFTFLYSKRSNTPAATKEAQVSEAVMKDRFDRLLAVVQEEAQKVCARFAGTIQEALVECVNEKDDTLVTGRLDSNLLVHFPGSADLIGQFVEVKLTTCKGFYYLGEQIQETI